MKDKIEIKESGAVGQPGESTTVTAKNLTSGGIADLLNSEFAKPEPDKKEDAPGEEIPPGEKSEAALTEEERAAKAAEEAAGGKTAEEIEAERVAAEKAGEGKTQEELEAEAAEAERAAAEELPPEMQEALDAWEEKGGALPAALQKVVAKRIGKLTAATAAEKDRADKAEADLKKVAAEADALRNDPQRPGNGIPASLPDEAVLTRLAGTAEKFVAEVESYLDDSATPEEKARVEKFMASKQLDAAGLKRQLRETNHWLNKELPGQVAAVRQFKQLELANEPVAKQYFGKLDDQASPEYAQAQAIRRTVPELATRTPAHKIAAGTYVLGLKVLAALKAAGIEGDAFGALDGALAKTMPPKGKTTPPKTPPPKAPAGAGGAPPANRMKAKGDEAVRQQFNKAPTRQNATDLARAALME